jgi:hypothetical protein
VGAAQPGGIIREALAGCEVESYSWDVDGG